MAERAPHPGFATDQPLRGIRVIELGNYIAAPMAGRMLADFGAEVVKVERPGSGDELRKWRLYEGDTSMLYRTLNRNKLSIELDLKSDEGRSAVLDLLAGADILLENFRPGTLDRWGLDAARLAEVNPELIVARISAFGQTGPLADRAGFAAVAEAYGGLRELVGEPDRPPSRTGVSIGDSIAGLYAAFGVVMALFDREARRRDGLPGCPPTEREVDVALHESVFSMMESLVPDFSAHGVRRERVGGRMEGIAPSNAYRCADGKSVVIAGNGDSIFVRYMTEIGRGDLAADPGLADNAGRWARRGELDDAIEAWTGSLSRDEVLERLNAAQVPAGPIHTAEDIIGDVQFRARGMIQDLPVDIAGETRIVAFPGVVPVLTGTSVPVRHVAPDLGADTASVLGATRRTSRPFER